MENTMMKISQSLDSLHKSGVAYNTSNVKIIENFGKVFGNERLEKLLGDNDLFASFLNAFLILPQAYVYKFINSLSENISKESIFDPWMTLTSPARIFIESEISGITINQEDYALSDKIFGKTRSVILGNPAYEIDNIKGEFDFIVSLPPFGSKYSGNDKELKNLDLATTLIAKCGKLLKSEGRIACLMSNAFLLNEKNQLAINKFGLFVDAIFSVPHGAFSPVTGISTNIIVFTKVEREKIFVAEICDDEATNRVILSNYESRKIGKIAQLGSLVNLCSFTTMSSFLADIELQNLSKAYGYPSKNLSEVITEINILKADSIEDVDKHENSIYIPKNINGKVICSTSEMEIKPKNYIQIVLNESKANASFLANYFNSQLGLKLRERLSGGFLMPQISKSTLLEAEILLPEISAQTQIIEVDERIKKFALHLDELKRSLWKYPKSYKTIGKELSAINKEDKLEHWIDKLPFPISSILWRYYATTDSGKKIEHLFHFFEAFSEFLSMIMLSALMQDDHFYKSESHNWIDKDEKFKNWYHRATFGNWNMLTRRLSNAIRGYLSDKEKRDYCSNLLGNPSESFISMITNKQISNALEEVANLRNKWKGHGGISSNEENCQRSLILEQKLIELRKVISDAFEELRIISPTTSCYEDGIFNFNAKELIGARTPFNEIEIKSTIPLDRKKLYLHTLGQIKPIKLLPFIKYIEDSNAIYFYTSIESKNARWVSYHFEKEAEIKQPAENELFTAFELLKFQI